MGTQAHFESILQGLFLTLAAPREAMGFQNYLFGAILGAKRRKKHTLFLEGSQEGPWEGFLRDLEWIWEIF